MQAHFNVNERNQERAVHARISVSPKSDHSDACSNTFRNAARVLGDTADSADNNTLGSGIRRALTKPPVYPTKIARQRDMM